MNVLVVSNYQLYQNYSDSFVHQQAVAYVEAGHRVRVLIPIAIGRRNAEGERPCKLYYMRKKDGVELIYLHFLSLSNLGGQSFNRKSMIWSLSHMWRTLIADFQPDVIHSHAFSKTCGVGVWLKQKLHCPLVVTTHGSDVSVPYEQGEMGWVRACCDQADAAVAVSSALADKLRACGTRTPISVILNGFAVKALPAASTSRQPCSVIQVGHLIAQKHFDVTIQAIAQLRKKYPQATLTIVGQGPEREKLEALCRELGLEDAVRFTGQLPNRDVLAEMAKAQFFCMPSVREGFGIVYLEAMASSCITIGTEGEGIADLMESGKNGFLVPPDHPDAIAEVMEWCLAHPAEAEAIAERGRQNALELTWERNAAAYIQLFQSLTSK